jgi:pectate lyase
VIPRLAIATLGAALWLTARALAAHATPGASSGSPQGFGASTRGAAGSAPYHVTNWNDSGPGSLRDAVSRGNRHVVFDVAGTITTFGRDVFVRGSFVTIDGTSAPPPGITLTGRGLRVDGSKGAHDVIIRGLRIRNVGASGVGDGIGIGKGAYNVLVDHVSIGDTADGSIDVTRGARDVTVQWSILEKKPTHNLLSLNSYGATRLTYHHNLFIGGESRNPQVDWNVAGAPPEIVVDVRNNLIWDFSQYGTTVLRGALANVVANYYWSSTQSDPGRALRLDTASRAYARGNISQNGGNVDAQGTESVPFAAQAVDTTDACTAAKDVVAHAGPRPLDAHDQALVSSVRLRCPDSSGGSRAGGLSAVSPSAARR